MRREGLSRLLPLCYRADEGDHLRTLFEVSNLVIPFAPQHEFAPARPVPLLAPSLFPPSIARPIVRSLAPSGSSSPPHRPSHATSLPPSIKLLPPYLSLHPSPPVPSLSPSLLPSLPASLICSPFSLISLSLPSCSSQATVSCADLNSLALRAGQGGHSLITYPLHRVRAAFTSPISSARIPP